MSLALVASASAVNIDVYVIAGQSNAGGGAWPVSIFVNFGQYS